MSTAQDTPDGRLAAYQRLFARALSRRERRGDVVVLTFRALPDIRETVEDLARREAACCPFLDYRVETTADEVTWTISADGREGVGAVLDAFHALPGDAGATPA